MSLKIIGIGKCRQSDYENNKIPYKKFMPKAISKSSGTLARMIFIAVSNALKSAKLDEKISIPIISATGLSELDGGTNLITQIFETKGEMISPILVQNTVANAPAGFLTIGFENKSPAITLSQSFLSLGTAFDFAFTLLKTSEYKRAIIVGGEAELKHWKELIQFENNPLLEDYVEGAFAFIISKEENDKAKYGEIINSCVYHIPKEKKITSQLIKRMGFALKKDIKIFVSEVDGRRINDISALSNRLKIKENQIKYLKNDNQKINSQPFLLYNILIEKGLKEVLLLQTEQNSLSIMQIIK